MVEEPKDRLKRAREKAGFESAAAAARRFNWPYSTYAAHENGQNDISRESAAIYSRTFKVPAGWILTGEGGLQDNSVALRGYVGGGFAVMPLGDDTPELERVKRPPGAKGRLEAVKVQGKSMEPAFYDGDTLFYDVGAGRKAPGELLGEECIVALKSGEMYVKRLLKGSQRGRYVLHSYNSDPILDVEVDWASKIEYIKRA